MEMPNGPRLTVWEGLGLANTLVQFPMFNATWCIGIANVKVMLTVGLTEAKRRLEELVKRAERGERIRITKYGKLKAEIAPVPPSRRKPSA